jgi:hypothetical protein
MKYFMEALEAVAKRTSTGKVKEAQVSEENLQAILKAGMESLVGSGLYQHLQLPPDKLCFMH